MQGWPNCGLRKIQNFFSTKFFFNYEYKNIFVLLKNYKIFLIKNNEKNLQKKKSVFDRLFKYVFFFFFNLLRVHFFILELFLY